jgi:lysozyme family protein
MVLSTVDVSINAVQSAAPFALAVLQRCLDGSLAKARDGRVSLGHVDLPAFLADPAIVVQVNEAVHERRFRLQQRGAAAAAGGEGATSAEERPGTQVCAETQRCDRVDPHGGLQPALHLASLSFSVA